MIPLEAMRQLLSDPPQADGARSGECWYCCTAPHAPDCPWLVMPQIVAIIEAAEEVATMCPSHLTDHHDCDGSEWCVIIGEGTHHVFYCEGCDECAPCDCDTHAEGIMGAHLRAWARLVHHDNCPLQTLVGALKGGVPV